MATDESPIRDRDPIPTDAAVDLLNHGAIEILGRMPYSSNGTFLVDIEHDGTAAQAIYKPLRGERPLWDFPSGLYTREVAAFLMSEALGWSLVPPTVVRKDAPLEVGSLQLFMPADFEQHYFTLVETGRHDTEFQQLCALDIVINNTDRKSGHCLLGTDGRIWAIDNGLAFHYEYKLRTVIWDYADEPIPADIQDRLEQLVSDGLPAEVSILLPSVFERDAVLSRAKALLSAQRFPTDDDGHRWPWPLV